MVVLLTIEDKEPNSNTGGGGGSGWSCDYQLVCFFWWCCIPISIGWFSYTLTDLCCGDCYRIIRKRKKQDKEQ